MTNSPSTNTASVPTMRRERKPGMDLTIVNRLGLREYHLSLQPLPGENPSVMLWRLDRILRENEAIVVKHDIFGSVAACEETLGRLNRLFGELTWPVTWVEGRACSGSALAGMHVFAISGATVETVHLDGRIVGRAFSDGLARHCLLGDVRPADLSASNPVQAGQLFENIEAALDRAGLRMTDLVRTWLFLDDILSWYTPFNVVRKEFFEHRKLFDHLVPASTGVGSKNPAAAALVAAAWGMQPLDDRSATREVTSPLQCPAPSYGSCFSRAVEISTPNHRRLLISGTASIDFEGNSTRLNDIKGQVEHTMDVVEAILRSRDLTFAAVARGTGYFRQLDHGAVFREWCLARGVTFPVINLQSDICRDELLFELELDAMAPCRAGKVG